MRKILISLIIMLVVIGVILVYSYQKGNLALNTGQAGCTMEAKICPDGSSVGRTGPKCEFTLCPIVSTPSTNPHDDLIKVSTPIPNATVTSPLVIKGMARGNWYFEGSFPVKILDAKGRELGKVPASAQGDWMNTNFVPFVATLNFTKSPTSTGTIILEKDNPSDLPQNADHISIPVKFANSNSQGSLGKCIRTGCNSQICSDKEMITTCEYSPQYACYKAATCERQINGSCGWTQTSALSACLKGM